jgi:signal transduction histidine kinase
MKSAWIWTVAVLPLLVLVLTWLSLGALDTDAEPYDRALGEMDRQAMLQAGLHRDVLSARAGMLRNYDPLVQEVGALEASLARLRRAPAVGPEAAAVVGRLASSLDREEMLVEQFKSDNALLQNSLSYFQLFASRLGTMYPAGPMAGAVGALAGAMLRLTLDTSPATAREVEDRLQDLARQPVPESDAPAAKAFLAHGRLLHDLLPSVDHTLKVLSTLPRQQDWQTLRTILLTHQDTSQTIARRFRIALFATSLLLAGCLIHLAVRLRARARALRRRAAFERVITGISMRFLAARGLDLEANIERALADLAICIGADRAYFLPCGQSRRQHTWCRPGAAFPPGWPDQALTLAAKFRRGGEEILLISAVASLPLGELRDQCLVLGLRGWVCTVHADGNDACSVLGFDMLHDLCRVTRTGELGLMRMALDTLLNATTREFLERDKARLEMRLEQARRMETLGTFASGIAHNFNNILAAILGYTDLAEEQAARNGPRQPLAEIRRAAEQARVLVEQVLTFGRRGDARRQPIEVPDLVAEAASLLQASLPPQVALILQPSSEAVTVVGEHAHLLQVILNLGNNAVKAMDGVGRLEIATDVQWLAAARSLSHGVLAPGCYACISVSDAGHGIEQAILSRIFEPFFTTRSDGNGLGLATAREIVREHRGAMNVESTPGIGSRFEVWLPCVQATVAAPDEEVPELPRGHGQTVLMVDADRERLLRHEEMLAALGYEPAGFTSADAALRACREDPKRFDMVLMGQLRSTAAAFELATALHRIEPTLPVVLATASADKIHVESLLAAGISDVVHWPIDAGEIAAALDGLASVVEPSV